MKNRRSGWNILRWENTGAYILAAMFFAMAIGLGEEFAHHIETFEDWLARLGSSAYVIAIVLYAICSTVLIPDTLLGIAAGAAFGFDGGVVVALGGSLLAAGTQFLLAKRMLKPFIDRKLASRPSMLLIQEAVRKQQFRLQFLIRLTPLNRALASYMVGSAGVRFAWFMLACAGFLPHLCLEVYLGYAGKHLARISGQSGYTTAATHNAMLIAGLVFAAIAIYAISRTAKAAIKDIAGTSV